MRPACILLVLFLSVTLIPAPSTLAQPQVNNITLYARSDQNTLSLSAQAPTGPQQSADVSNIITFTLSPVLGTDLEINGAIFVTIFLRAGAFVAGTVNLQLAELRRTGEQVLIPGAFVAGAPLSLDTVTHPFSSGVGPIQYKLQRGSSIQLQVQVKVQAPYASQFFTPFLVWNAPLTQTSLTIQVVEPTKATVTIDSDTPRFGRIIRTATNDKANVTFAANVTDPLGLERFVSSLIVFTSSNGTSIQLRPIVTPGSIYSAVYSRSAQLSQGRWQIGLRLVDGSENTQNFESPAWVASFFNVGLTVVDPSGRPLENALVMASFRNEGNWSAHTNATGVAILNLPSSEIVGPLNITVIWNKFLIPNRLSINVAPSQTFRFIVPLYDVTIHLTTAGFPLPNTEVWLVQGVAVVAHSTTGFDGTVTFNAIPGGNYTLLGYLFARQYTNQIDVTSNRVYSVDLPLPYEIPALLIAILVSSISIVVVRRRSKFYPHSFKHFNELMMGGLPRTCFALIAGNSGSGKSVLLESLAAEHLAAGEACVYIINTEYPAKIRENMLTLGMPISGAMEKGKLLFIDSYSAVGGTVSKENYFVSSHTDLTGLGMRISKCLDELGLGTDIYFDSIMPLLAALRTDYLLNFLQSIAAKVKANEGRLCVTVGTALSKDDLVKLEEASDCVIETQLQESGRGQRRKLRVKKLRGKPYIDKWVNFQVETGKGIVFLTRTRSEKGTANNNR